jgi:predicted MFS family arabinose efflux permease
MSTVAPPAATTSKPFSWRFTTPLFIGSALNPINSSLIATALVAIAAGLHVSIGQTAALVAALYVATTIAQPTAGKAADVFGPRRVFLTGILLVFAGGLVGGFAPNLGVLLVSRVLIGLGTSCAYPTAMMLIRRRADAAGLEKPPGGVLGGLQIAGIATSALGLPIGGVLVQYFGWRSVFSINVPVAIIAFVATLLWIPKDAPFERRTPQAVMSALDVIGIIGFAGAMTSLLTFLWSLPDANWASLAITIVLWIALVLRERSAKTPFFDVRLLASNRPLTRTYLRFAIVNLCIYAVIYGITQWLEASRGVSGLMAGLLLLPMTLISAIVIIPISRRNLMRTPLLMTAAACIIASVGILFLHTGAWLVLALAVTIVLGVALGAGASGNQTALYTQAGDQLGIASGLMRSFGYIGSIASSAIIGIVFHQEVTDAGVSTIGWIMLGASIVLLAVTFLDRTLERSAASV